MNTEHSSSETRNSKARQFFKPVVRHTAEFIYDHTKLTPNQITAIGNICVGLGAYFAYEGNKPESKHARLLKISATAAIGIGSACDSLDGELARIYEERQPGFHNSKNGQNIDASSDRLQELTLGIGRIVSAHERNDRFGQVLASVSTIAQGLPSVWKAYAESKGRIVPETGNSSLEIIGTRAGRAVANTTAVIAPEVQKPVDSVIIGTTAVTIFDRAKIALAYDPERKLDVGSEETKEKAKTRLKYMGAMALLSIGTVAGTNYLLHKKDNRK